MASIYHAGVKGMKWGVRNQNKKPLGEYGYSIHTSKGETVHLKSSGRAGKRSQSFKILNSKYKKIGNLYLENMGHGELNINWIDIKKKQRGHKFAQAVMKSVVDRAKKQGYSRLTLEVPTDSPDAHHIYKKQGFKDKSALTKDDVWGGLTTMEKRLR